MRPASDDEEPPLAETIVELDVDNYPAFVADALDSGLALAAGEPPLTTAVVRVRDRRLISLVMVGGREVWEPASPLEAPARWLSAAKARGSIVMIVVPPGTWPEDLPELPSDIRDGLFTTMLEEVYAAGQVLHGTARLVEEGPITRQSAT